MNHKTHLFTIGAAVASLLAACGGSHHPADAGSGAASPRDELIQRLADASRNKKVLFGHHDDPVYGHSWWADSGRSDILEITGAYPAMMSWDLGGLENGDSLNLDSVPFSRMRQEALAQHARGGVNTFSWHLTRPFGAGTSWDVDDPTVVQRLLHNPADSAWMADAVASVARFFGSLTDADNRPVAVIFRPWHEHTGSWFWWGNGNCSKEDYIELWRRTRAIMDANGADNVVWAYAPDCISDSAQYLDRYPGDEYVDIMGADIYHRNADAGTDAYRSNVRTTLGAAAAAAADRGKILAFTETGCETLPITDWFTSVLLPVVKEYPIAYVTVWRNARNMEQHFFAPWPGHPAADDFKAFYSDSATVFVAPAKL